MEQKTISIYQDRKRQVLTPHALNTNVSGKIRMVVGRDSCYSCQKVALKQSLSTFCMIE
jgi:hypothetical protein